MSQKTTKKARTEKSRTVKKAIRRTRTKERKKTTEETTTKQVIRVKDVGELVEYCKTLLGRKPFQGASIDFHPKKPAFIFIPNDNSVTKVHTEALLDFLKERNVRSVLVDALNKKKASVLAELCNAGIEVYVLRRPGYIKRMREELERHGIKVPKTDKYDAVLLAYAPPKKWMKVDSRFLKSWEAMISWRGAEMNYQVLLQRDKANNSEGAKEDEKDEELRRIREMIRAKLEEVQRVLEEVQKLEAQLFVLKVQKYYPGVDEDFDKYGIRDDVIAQAYYCESFLEALHCDSEAGFLVKSGIGVAGSPPAKQRKKPFIHDGALNRALIQLTVKVYHLDPYKDEDQKKIKMKARKLAEKIWRKAQKMKAEIESGRVGEASGPAPLEKRGFARYHPRPFGRGLLQKQESIEFLRPQAPDTRPTDNHTAVT
jgi:uroporphyrinogen-III synthase